MSLLLFVNQAQACAYASYYGYYYGSFLCNGQYCQNSNQCSSSCCSSSSCSSGYYSYCDKSYNYYYTDSSVGALIGYCVGGVIFLVAIFVIICCRLKRIRQMRAEGEAAQLLVQQQAATYTMNPTMGVYAAPGQYPPAGQYPPTTGMTGGMPDSTNVYQQQMQPQMQPQMQQQMQPQMQQQMQPQMQQQMQPQMQQQMQPQMQQQMQPQMQQQMQPQMQQQMQPQMQEQMQPQMQPQMQQQMQPQMQQQMQPQMQQQMQPQMQQPIRAESVDAAPGASAFDQPGYRPDEVAAQPIMMTNDPSNPVSFPQTQVNLN